MLGSAGIIMLISALAQAIQNRSYAQCSLPVNGRVTQKRSRNVKHGMVYEFTVTYTVDGIVYERIVGALPEEMSRVDIDDGIELLCKPDNPKRVVRPAQLAPRNVKIVLIIGAALTVAGVALFVIGQL